MTLPNIQFTTGELLKAARDASEAKTFYRALKEMCIYRQSFADAAVFRDFELGRRKIQFGQKHEWKAVRGMAGRFHCRRCDCWTANEIYYRNELCLAVPDLPIKNRKSKIKNPPR